MKHGVGGEFCLSVSTSANPKKQARNAEAAVAETATVYFSHDGVITNSDVIFYDSD